LIPPAHSKGWWNYKNFELSKILEMNKIIRKLKDIKKKFFGIPIDPYWIKETSVKRCHDRYKVFFPHINEQKVLHIGCTDFPYFDPENNLHITMSKHAKTLHGMDIDVEGMEVLKKYCGGEFFSDLKEINEKYDLVIATETIEHVPNIQLFLEQINSVDASTYIISGPNSFYKHFKNELKSNGKFSELVHHDHNCWFSPYTLKNCIQKYTDLKVNEIFLANHDMMVICICSKNG